MSMEEAAYRTQIRTALEHLSDMRRVIPGVDGIIGNLNGALAALDAEWSVLRQKEQYTNQRAANWIQERETIARQCEIAWAGADKTRKEKAELLDKLERFMKLFSEQAEANMLLRQAIVKQAKAAAKQPPRPTNGTRGSQRSPRTGPNAPRPTRASGKTSPSRSATGKPSRCGGSGASPKTPRTATARPKRTARKTPRTG